VDNFQVTRWFHDLNIWCGYRPGVQEPLRGAKGDLAIRRTALLVIINSWQSPGAMNQTAVA